MRCKGGETERGMKTEARPEVRNGEKKENFIK